MKKEVQNIITGIVFSVASIATILFATYDNNKPTGNTYYALFENVDGIKKKTPVYFTGVRVGHAVNIGLQNERVLVKIIVNENIFIPSDSTLQVETPDLFSTKVLNISPGFEDIALEKNAYFESVQNSVDFLGILNAYLDSRIKEAKKEK